MHPRGPDQSTDPLLVARPNGAPPAGGVVMTEGKGWQLLRVCERLASEGYVAVAPNVCHRPHAGDGDWQKALESTHEKIDFSKHQPSI